MSSELLTRSSASRRRSLLRSVCLVVASVVLGCKNAPPLTRADVRSLIEQSEAFSAPMDPSIVFIDTTFHPGSNTKREFIAISGIAVKDDGPFGMAGQTATVVFTWQWTEGPYAHRVLRSKAKLNCSSGTWKVYADYLTQHLWASERGEED